MCLHTTDEYDRLMKKVTSGFLGALGPFQNLQPVHIFSARSYSLIGSVPANFRDTKAIIQAASDLLDWHEEDGAVVWEGDLESRFYGETGSTTEAERQTAQVMAFLRAPREIRLSKNLLINPQEEWEDLTGMQARRTIRDFRYIDNPMLRVA